MESLIDKFRTAIINTGLMPPEVIKTDGQIHRFSTNGKPSDKSGWYVYFDVDAPAGRFGDWRTGIDQTWCADIGRKLTPEEKEIRSKNFEKIRLEREADERERHKRACIRAAEEWNQATPAPNDHPYIINKRIKVHGLRISGDLLLIPLRIDNTIHSLQYIYPNGEKRFLPGGRKNGCYFSIGKLQDVICISEGMATAASIFEATGHPVAVAFDAGNLGPVAEHLRSKFPNAKLIICADDDVWTAGNPGISKARQAALRIGGWLAIPKFKPDQLSGSTDFNDLAQEQGLDAVRTSIENAEFVSSNSGHYPKTNHGEGDTIKLEFISTDWPEPEPLFSSTTNPDYPIEFLPIGIRRAVQEVNDFVQCPISLTACSALSSLSLAAQGLIDVQRDERLAGPVSLFILALADSGERKTTCDNIFTDPIRKWENEQNLAMQGIQKEYDAAIKIWQAKNKAIIGEIEKSAKSRKSSEELERELRILEAEKPTPPRIPRLLYIKASSC